jgi:cell division transport system permease protein
MRASFVFSEVVTGLKRNVTMTIAMILTTAISLLMLGFGLLVVSTVGKMNKQYLSEVQVSVYLTNDISANDGTCGQNPCKELLAQMRATPLVQTVRFENRQEAFERFKEIFAENKDLVALARPEGLPASLRVKLKDPTNFGAIENELKGKPGVDKIVDQRQYLENLFGFLNGLRNAAFVLAGLSAVAAVLLISNMIQISAFTRRTEVGIMRLVGATRWYTQLPFLLEAVVTGAIGSLLAAVLLLVVKNSFLDSVLSEIFSSGIVPHITSGDVATTSLWLFLCGVLVAASTAYVTLRLYVRV